MKKIKLNEILYSLSTIKFALLLFFGLFTVTNTANAAFSSQDQQEEFSISGTIFSDDGSPLPGATILVIGTSKGTVTDGDGIFKLVVTAGAKLLVSFVGYTNQEITVGTSQTTYDVTLLTDLEQLSEVVVIGYGTQKRSHLTGAVSKVVNKDLEQIAVARVDEALVGKIAGVNIQATDGSVGSAPTIRIRGTGSITAGAGPLLVIDGVPVDSDFFGSVDMNDVESFEVLKDAASAAIYGSRGANGVIIITTKQGKQGKTKFSYNGFTGFQDVANNPNYNMSVAEGAAIEMAETGELSARTRYKQLIGVDNNWQDIIFDGGIINSHSIAARGGSEKTKFSTSMSYLHDEGVLLTDDFKKYNFRAKVDTRVNDVFSFGVNINPSYTNRRRFAGSTHDILRQTPWLPVRLDENTIQFVDRNVFPDAKIGDYTTQRMFDNYDLDGDGVLVDISNTSNVNPVAKIEERERIDKKFKMFASFYTTINFTEDLSFRGALSGDIQDTKTTRWQGALAHRNGAANAQSFFRDDSRIHLVSEGFFNYKKTIGNHDINAVFGVSAERWRHEQASITGIGYQFDYITTINAATTIADASSWVREKSYLSFVGRANYAYADKYLASVTMRRDGSSVFGRDTQFGNFPAASVGWRISEESFLNNSNVVSNLKLRVSYGITGNDAINTDDDLLDWYAYTALLETTTAVVNGGITTGFNPTNIANPLLGWERSVEINPAIDFGFFSNRISGSIDYYNRRSDGLLVDIDVSSVTGFNSALVNIGEVENAGFELELTTVNINKGDFRWSSTIVGSTNKNTLIDFADNDGLITNVDSKRAAEWINLVGQPISSYYGYVIEDQIPLEFITNPYHPIGAQAQDVYVRDLNGDGIIDNDDKTILGSPYPDFILSLSNTFSYKAFDLSFMFQGSFGAETRNMADQYIYNQFNSAQDFDPLITPNQEFIQQKIFTNSIIQDASYLALRTVNLGYTVPLDWIEKVGLTRVRIYASGQNLWYQMADGYTGFNPESIDNTSPINYGYQRGGSPIPRKITFGLSVDF